MPPSTEVTAMRRVGHGVLLFGAALASGLVLAACGGDSIADEAAAETEPAETAAVATTEGATGSTASSGTDAGPAPAPGKGALVLDDGRSFAITITECEFSPNGTFTVKGTSEQGSTFEMTQFFLGEDWSQSQVSIEFPNRDQVFVIVSKASQDGAPADVDGKSVSWVRTFSELDESANDIVYRGTGTLRLTCA
jgi:hypothetical protein